jgi:hypothetical protein
MKPSISKITKKETDGLSVAIRYYSVLSAIGDLDLTKREIQLIAFTAIKGNISYSTNRNEFCNLYKSSSPTINNMISKLKKKSILIKDGGKIKVNPKLLINFETGTILQLWISR